MANEGRERDLVLAPQQFAYVQDETKGHINTFVGPAKTSLSNTDKPVRYNGKRYEAVGGLDAAISNFPFAEEGDYIVLENPAVGEKNQHPLPGTSNNNPELQFGRKVNIPGPATFPLWPAQTAKVIKGHTLRSNQYLVVRVYNEEAARENWGNAVLKRQTESGETPKQTDKPPTFVTGQNLIIRGTNVSFFIPPTGIEVILDEENNYVRDAVTLERLEYAILINENGDKRYEMGPAVVFPEPTEAFIRKAGPDGSKTRRFRAYSLSKLAGLYVQVIADYNDDGSPVTKDKVEHRTGEELFIKGSEQAIYYPRPEHAIIKYVGADGKEQEVHNSVAIPEGEARYVLDRLTGVIELIRGLKMFLPDPRTQVIVRRVLTPKQSDLWFPGNPVAQLYNQQLADMQSSDPTGGGTMNFVSEGTYRSQLGRSQSSGIIAGAAMSGFEADYAAASPQIAGPGAGGSPKNIAPASAHFGDSVRRGTQYTPPRSIVIDTKYDGAVCIAPHQGYAVQIVSKTGERKVIVGPDAYLMEYDESLEVVRLSMGKPKNTDKLMETVYLQVHNNKVSDIVEVETGDMCNLDLKLSYRVNFDGDPKLWFGVENYVKLLCDHVRSRLKAAIKKHNIETFYQNATDIIRDIILGKDDASGNRTGLQFKENGMIVYDVEVLSTTIKDVTIAKMLQESMVNAFRTTIQLSDAAKKLDATQRLEKINQQMEEAKTATRLSAIQLKVDEVVKQFQADLFQTTKEIELELESRKKVVAEEETTTVRHGAELARLKSRADQDIETEKERQAIAIKRMQEDAKSLVSKFDAMKGDWSQAMLALSNNDTMVKVATATAPMKYLGGASISEVLMQIFENTPLKAALENMKRGEGTGTGHRQLTENRT